MNPTDRQIKDAIKDGIETATSSLSVIPRVIPRWKLSLRAKDFKSALRSVTSNDIVDGFFITRTGIHRERIGVNHYHYKWTYAIWYFKQYQDGASEDELNDTLDLVGEWFEGNPTLSFDSESDGVLEHEEFQVETIDTIDLEFHIVQARLTVCLERQGT